MLDEEKKRVAGERQEAQELKRAKANSESNQRVTSAGSNDVGPSVQIRESLWEPKHTIFLSHSGAQKSFTEHLFDALKRDHRSSFFDKDPDSLCKGEKFLPRLEDAAKNCSVAVLVLSDEFFTRSKWPLMELNMFVKAQEKGNPGLRILPLFFGITMDKFKEEMRLVNEPSAGGANKSKNKCWLTDWNAMKKDDDSIDLNEWKDALPKIREIDSLIYAGTTKREPGFMKEVVAAIRKLVPPDNMWDVSHVQEMDRLCKPILKRMDEIVQSPEYKGMIAASPEILKPCVVGLYGMGGVGKTTISRAIFNEKAFGDFDGKVCYVELGGMTLVELLKTVLQELTEVNPESLRDSLDKLFTALKERMRHQKVFLILDNVWDHQIQEVREILDIEYCPGSMVLVTSRSLDILVQLLHIPALHCLEMPKLTREGAEAAFLHFTGRPKDQPINDVEKDIIKRCLKECCFLKSKKFIGSNQETESVYHYLPLALKVLGSQLGSISHDVLRWEKCLERLETDKFNLLKDNVNPVYSVLRLGYDALRSEERYIFLDMALLWQSTRRSVDMPRDLCYQQNWMRIMHRKSEDDMKESVNALRRKGLLDRVNEANWMDYNIHDLYAEFAEEEARMGPFEGRRFLIDKNGTDVPHELLKYPSGQCWASLERLIIQDSKVQSLKKAKLHLCKNLEVLVLAGCDSLKEVDVSGMENLRSMEVLDCEPETFVGVKQLSNLVLFYWCSRTSGSFYDGDVPMIDTKVLDDLKSLTTLQVLKLKYIQCKGFSPDLSGCTNLRELTISNSNNDKHYQPDMRTSSAPLNFKMMPESVLKIDFSTCPFSLEDSPISSMSSFTNLQELNLNHCEEIDDLRGLCKLISLQKLAVRNTQIAELSGLGKLEQLQVLDVSFCENLVSILPIAHEHTDASGREELSELEDDWSGLKKLEMVDMERDVALSMLPKGYETLARRNILNVKGCWGLVAFLVEELHRCEGLHVGCVNAPGCVGSCEQSMKSWIDAMKHVSYPVYDLLKNVFRTEGYFTYANKHWNYFLDDGERVDCVIRALWEHYCRRGRKWLSSVVENVTPMAYHGYVSLWWVVVTAPCTFEIVTKRAMLEPWEKTLLHYTVKWVIPYLLPSMPPGPLANKGLKAVLQKCKEKLEEASEKGIDLERCAEGKQFVGTVIKEIEESPNKDMTPKSVTCEPSGRYYHECFPDYVFGPALKMQDTSGNILLWQIK